MIGFSRAAPSIIVPKESTETMSPLRMSFIEPMLEVPAMSNSEYLSICDYALITF